MKKLWKELSGQPTERTDKLVIWAFPVTILVCYVIDMILS